MNKNLILFSFVFTAALFVSNVAEAAPSCYPNPVGRSCYIACSNSGSQPVGMYTSSGESVSPSIYTVNGGWLVYRANLSNGVYYIRGADNGTFSSMTLDGSSCFTPTVTINASPNPAAGTPPSSTITWNGGMGVTNCTVTGNGNTWTGASGSQNSGALSSQTTFNLSCSWPGGTRTGSVTVNVGAALNLSGAEVTNNPAGNYQLTWSSTNANTCTASSSAGDWPVSATGTVPTSGTRLINQIPLTETYSISCTGPGGTASTSLTHTFNASVVLSTAPRTVNKGASTLITWLANFANSCSPISWADNSTSTSGMKLVPIASGETRRRIPFSITCVGDSGTPVTKSIPVFIRPTFSCNP